MLLHTGKAFCSKQYTLLSARRAVVHVPLLHNYTLGIASYLWTNEVLLFFPSSLVFLTVNRILTLGSIHVCALSSKAGR